MPMTDTRVRRQLPLCPSAQPGMESCVLFAVADGAGERPPMSYLAAPLPVTAEVLALAGSVVPAEIFRFAAPCARQGCRHFDGSDCRLVARVVQFLPRVVEKLPPCSIRPEC